MNAVLRSSICASLLVIGGPALAQNSLDERIAKARANAIATGIDFDMDEAAAPFVDKYSACLTANRPMIINGQPTQAIATEKAIQACRKERKQLIAEADAALAKTARWPEPVKRSSEVNATFDNTDASARKLARETDAYYGRDGR